LRANKHILLDHEDPAAFEALRASLMLRLQPADEYEEHLAHRVAVSLWRSNRGAFVEAASMDYTFNDTYETGPDEFTPAQRFQRGLIASMDNPHLDPILRHEATMERRHEKALALLNAAQASRLFGMPVTPGSYHIALPIRPPSTQNHSTS
jgi:hypothetical protein